MANTKTLSFCPYCNAELDSPTPSHCPSCNTQLYTIDNKFIQSPNYVTAQMKKLGDSLNLDSPKVRPSDRKDWEEAQFAFGRWLETAADADRLYCMQDALHFLSCALTSNVHPDNLKKMVHMAKQIGELGNSINDYISSGGKYYVRKVGPVQARSGDIPSYSKDPS